MRKSRYTKQQVVEVLRGDEADVSVVELNRHHGVREQTIYR